MDLPGETEVKGVLCNTTLHLVDCSMYTQQVMSGVASFPGRVGGAAWERGYVRSYMYTISRCCPSLGTSHIFRSGGEGVFSPSPPDVKMQLVTGLVLPLQSQNRIREKE